MTSSRNIAIFHYKVGGTDGVSLEIDKWKRVLEEMGHSVYLCAGDLGSVEGTLIKEFYHHYPPIERLYRNTFLTLSDLNVDSYRYEMEHWVEVFSQRLREFINKNKINLLIPQNIWSVAANPPLAIAMARVMREYKLPTVAHHHDFYWERYENIALTCSPAIDLADKYLPPRDSTIKHVVINSLTQKELLEHKGISSEVVPNVFDFDGTTWKIDADNADFRERLGLRENDLLILQATRIVPRKGIELAIDFVKALNLPERRARLQKQGLYNGKHFDESSRIVLVLVGYATDDLTGHYKQSLQQKAKKAGVETLFIEDLVRGRRGSLKNQKVYSLWDTYPHADLITYPSLWEGWGNQLLEALYAKLPVVLFEYPVYQKDIADKKFKVISLGNKIVSQDSQGLVQVSPDVIERAANQAVDFLTKSDYREQVVEYNYEVAQENYSLAVLRRHLDELIGS